MLVVGKIFFWAKYKKYSRKLIVDTDFEQNVNLIRPPTDSQPLAILVTHHKFQTKLKEKSLTNNVDPLGLNAVMKVLIYQVHKAENFYIGTQG